VNAQWNDTCNSRGRQHPSSSAAEGTEDEMSTDYVFLCGVMWAQHRSLDAGWELIRALDSADPDVASLANAILRRTLAGNAVTGIAAGR